MSVYRRYFKVETGPLVEGIKEALRISDESTKEYTKIIEDIGGNSDHWYHRDGKLVEIVFDDAPDSKLFKKVRDGWMPKLNCKKGKALQARIDAVETRYMNDCLPLIGLHDSPCLFMEGKVYWSSVVVIPDDPVQIFVQVPWYDEDPKVIEEYNNAKTHMSTNLNHIQWCPTEDMKPIARWEIDKKIEEWKESNKKETP